MEKEIPSAVFRTNADIHLDDFIDLYRRSTLGERRPVDDREIMQAMKDNSALTISAWVNNQPIGIARTLTDFEYVAYLADLAVDEAFQKTGIGKQLIQRTREALGPNCMLVLLAAPAANEYYPHLGFQNNPRAWVLRGDEKLL